MYISPDLLLWHALPDGADVVRAFFSEDRSRRILVYRRKTALILSPTKRSNSTNTSRNIGGVGRITN